MRMKDDHMRNGQPKPGYSGQIAVSSEYITGLEAFSDRSDATAVRPMMRKLAEKRGKPYEETVADAGCKSLDNGTAEWPVDNRRMVPLRRLCRLSLPRAMLPGKRLQSAQGSSYAKNFLGKVRTGYTQYFIRARHSSTSVPFYSSERRVCVAKNRFWVSPFSHQRQKQYSHGAVFPRLGV